MGTLEPGIYDQMEAEDAPGQNPVNEEQMMDDQEQNVSGEERRMGGQEQAMDDQEQNVGGEEQRMGGQEQAMDDQEQNVSGEERRMGGQDQAMDDQQQNVGGEKQKMDDQEENVVGEAQAMDDHEHNTGEKETNMDDDDSNISDQQHDESEQEQKMDMVDYYNQLEPIDEHIEQRLCVQEKSMTYIYPLLGTHKPNIDDGKKRMWNQAQKMNYRYKLLDDVEPNTDDEDQSIRGQYQTMGGQHSISDHLVVDHDDHVGLPSTSAWRDYTSDGSATETESLVRQVELYNTIKDISCSMAGKICFTHDDYYSQVEYTNGRYRYIQNPTRTAGNNPTVLVTPVSGTVVQNYPTRTPIWGGLFASSGTITRILDNSRPLGQTHTHVDYDRLLCVSEDYLVLKKSARVISVWNLRQDDLEKRFDMSFGGTVQRAAINHVTQWIVVQTKAFRGIKLMVKDANGDLQRWIKLPSSCQLCCCCEEYFVVLDKNLRRICLYSWTHNFHETINWETTGIDNRYIPIGVTCSVRDDVMVLHFACTCLQSSINEVGQNDCQVVAYEIKDTKVLGSKVSVPLVELNNEVQGISSSKDGRICLTYNGYTIRYDYIDDQYVQVHNPLHTGDTNSRIFVTPTSGCTVHAHTVTTHTWFGLVSSTSTTIKLVDRDLKTKAIYRNVNYEDVLCVAEDRVVLKKNASKITVAERKDGWTLTKTNDLDVTGEVLAAVKNPLTRRLMVQVKEKFGTRFCVLPENEGSDYQPFKLPLDYHLCSCCEDFFIVKGPQSKSIILYSWTRDFSTKLSAEALGQHHFAIIVDVACSYANGRPVLHLVVQDEGVPSTRVAPYEVPDHIFQHYTAQCATDPGRPGR